MTASSINRAMGRLLSDAVQRGSDRVFEQRVQSLRDAIEGLAQPPNTITCSVALLAGTKAKPADETGWADTKSKTPLATDDWIGQLVRYGQFYGLSAHGPAPITGSPKPGPKTPGQVDNLPTPARVTRHHRLLCTLGRHQDTDLTPMYSEMGTVTLLACVRCGRVRAW